jgi:hypothetical protein
MGQISYLRQPKNVNKTDSCKFATGGDPGAGAMVVHKSDSLMNVKNKFTLRLPSDYSPRMLSGAESHIVEWAKAIAGENPLGIIGRGNLPYVAHRNLVVLPYPSVNQQPEMDRVYRVSSTRCQLSTRTREHYGVLVTSPFEHPLRLQRGPRYAGSRQHRWDG